MAVPDVHQTLATLLPRLRRFGLALTGSASDTDDLVQSVCERVLRNRDCWEEVSRVDAWLYRMMRNLWIDEIRSRKVRRHDDMDAAADVIGLDGQAAVDGRSDLAVVRNIIGQMAPELRSALILVCVDGLSYKEASQILDVPLGTIMSRISRARGDLHRRLAAQEQIRTTPGAVIDKTRPDRVRSI